MPSDSPTHTSHAEKDATLRYFGELAEAQHRRDRAEIERLRAALDRKNFALARAADRLNLIAGLSEPDKVEVRARWGADALSAFKAEPTLSPEAAKPLIDEELSRG